MNNKSKRTHSNEDCKRSPTKRQHRNENEKRRRDLFSQLIANLEEILCIETTNSSNIKLDKASILCQTVEYLKQHQTNIIFQINSSSKKCRRDDKDVDHIDEIVDFSWKPSSDLITIDEWIQIAIESMNCFFLVAKSDPHNGQIVYVSSNISSLLDYSQNELLNRSLFELILSRNHDQLRDYLLKDHRVLEKCFLSWRRATADEYEQCTIHGAFRQINQNKDEKYLISIVKINTLDRTLVINNQYLNKQFTTRLNLQGKFIYIDPKAREYLGYSSYELIGHTHFDFVHPDDLPIIVRAHQIWKENGNGRSDSYRFLSKGQQWIFLQTECQVQINSWTGKPESYLCTSFTLKNPIDSIQKHLRTTVSSSSMPNISNENPSQIDSILTNQTSTADSQITVESFLSHLTDENYRKTIRQKLTERKLTKKEEIRIRNDEINVIEDLIQFIDQFQTKQIDFKQQECYSNDHQIKPLEDYSSIVSQQNFLKDDLLPDAILSSIYSPSQQHLHEQISSPFIQLISPSNVNQQFLNQDINHSMPSQLPSSSNTDSNHEQSSTKTSSFNRSLPHSLVS